MSDYDHYKRKHLSGLARDLIPMFSGEAEERTRARLSPDLDVVREPVDGNIWAVRRVDDNSEVVQTMDLIDVGAIVTLSDLRRRLEGYSSHPLSESEEPAEKEDPAFR